MALTASEIKQINRLLLSWYKVSARPLKIRERSDPYAVLVAEVMSQQTQITRVDVFAERFLSRFPTLRSLARAETADVLEAWRGLGYNRRALLLHRAAVASHALGGIPTDVDSLEALPGVGPYTARAVAAIAGDGRRLRRSPEARRSGSLGPGGDGPRRFHLPLGATGLLILSAAERLQIEGSREGDPQEAKRGFDREVRDDPTLVAGSPPGRAARCGGGGRSGARRTRGTRRCSGSQRDQTTRRGGSC